MAPPSERTKHALAATLRAVGRAPNVEVVYTPAPTRLHGATAYLHLPIGQTSGALRADADSVALRLRYHKANTPVTTTAKDNATVIEACETARIESLGSEDFAGIALNLCARRDAYTATIREADLLSSHHIGLPLALRYLLCEHTAQLAPPPSAETFVRHWARLLKQRGKLSVEELAAARHDQAAFGRLCAVALERLLHIPDDTDKADAPPPEAGADDAPQQNDGDTAPHDDSPETSDTTNKETGDSQQPDVLERKTAQAALPDDTADANLSGETPNASTTPESSSGYEARSYTIYKTTYDTTANADTLAAAEDLATLRAQLDKQLIPYQNLIHRLANRLQRLLLALQQTEWRFDEDTGLINNARLPRLVTEPQNTAIFKTEQRGRYRDTVVTLLLDNSGSMRGKPITTTALTADILARTLERVQVKVEVLGFTTNTWKGGRVRDDWLKAGKPPAPGRLNEIRHIIYKPANVPWRRAKNNLALMLKEGILKENIDGEALQWAYRRLLARPEPRRILLVLADGAPVDDATISGNGAGYLEAHLRSVIAAVERDRRVELSALGIGHDVSRYYQHAVMIESVDDLALSLIGHLETLFR